LFQVELLSVFAPTIRRLEASVKCTQPMEMQAPRKIILPGCQSQLLHRKRMMSREAREENEVSGIHSRASCHPAAKIRRHAQSAFLLHPLRVLRATLCWH
jgi:hypothetical protein